MIFIEEGRGKKEEVRSKKEEGKIWLCLNFSKYFLRNAAQTAVS
ncbi:hypothetical protein [Okeania sp. SIO1I7]|nr:hypothetical protein [Okeania sp. SIO1I7]